MTECRLLTGKVALVTEAAAGIGEAVALYFAQDQAKVMVLDKDGDPAQQVVGHIQNPGGDAILAEADLRDAAAVSRAIDLTLRATARSTSWSTMPGCTRARALWK